MTCRGYEKSTAATIASTACISLSSLRRAVAKGTKGYQRARASGSSSAANAGHNPVYGHWRLTDCSGIIGSKRWRCQRRWKPPPSVRTGSGPSGAATDIDLGASAGEREASLWFRITANHPFSCLPDSAEEWLSRVSHLPALAALIDANPCDATRAAHSLPCRLHSQTQPQARHGLRVTVE